jgi:hypothetical protein
MRPMNTPQKYTSRECKNCLGHQRNFWEGTLMIWLSKSDWIQTERESYILSESESKLSYIKPGKYREVMISSKVSGSNRAFSFNRATDIGINFYQNLLEMEGLSAQAFCFAYRR